MATRKDFNPNEAIGVLRQKGIGNYTCPFCKGKDFSIQKDVATINYTTEIKTIQLANHIPSAIMVCKNCGNLQFFALGVLGLLNEKDGDNK